MLQIWYIKNMNNTHKGNQMKLGDTVKGNYFGSDFVGVISHFDCSGGITIDCAEPFDYRGEPRNGCYLFGADRQNAGLELVEACSPHQTGGVVASQGHYFLKK